MENNNFIGWSILFLFPVFGTCYYGYLKYDKVEQHNIIREYEKQSKKEQITDSYFGYISLPNQVQRIISYGNPGRVVAQSNIGIFGTVPDDLENQSLILVGHNRPNQFSTVPKLKQNEEVRIYRLKRRYRYHVVKRIIISADDLTFLDEIQSDMLVLITCLSDSSKRIVIFCKLQ